MLPVKYVFSDYYIYAIWSFGVYMAKVAVAAVSATRTRFMPPYLVCVLNRFNFYQRAICIKTQAMFG